MTAPLGEKVRLLRAERAWSQRELARQAKLSHQTVNRIEREPDYVIAMSTLAKLARAFRLRPNQLLESDELLRLTERKAEPRAA
jgi:transcriptional regulator with XRE-family HTH domain